jgi:hypothetical protein
MPPAKIPLKSDLLKAELAERLGVPVEDILNREEAAALLGRHPKTLSNEGLKAPCFYKGRLGRNGLALYVREQLTQWRADPVKWLEAHRELYASENQGHPLPWPLPRPMRPARPVNSAGEAILDHWGVSDSYKDEVLGPKS